MKETKTRLQRLRASRRSRSAARETKQYWGEVTPSKVDGMSDAQLNHSLQKLQNEGITRNDLARNDDTSRYDSRQQVRDAQHKKRNARKVNVLEKKLVRRRVMMPAEMERRAVLLSLQKRPASMPQGMYKALQLERKEIVNEHPKAERRDVPNMSNRFKVPKQAPVIRAQHEVVLGEKKLTKVQLKKLPADKVRFVSAGGKRKTGDYEVIGYKTIHHLVPFNVQLHG